MILLNVWPSFGSTLTGISSVIFSSQFLQACSLVPTSVNVGSLTTVHSPNSWPLAATTVCSTNISLHTEHFLPSDKPSSVQVASLPATTSSVCLAATSLSL